MAVVTSDPGSASMPNVPIFTFIPKVNEFITHWTNVNTALGSALGLPGLYLIAGLTGDRDNLNTLYTAVETADNAEQNAAADRDTKKAALRERLRQFRNTVKGRLAGSTYVNSLPAVFRPDGKEQDVLRALRDMANIWTSVNASPPAGFTPPLLLSGSYALATFNTDLAALQTGYVTWTATDLNASQARDNRNAIINPVIDRLVQYRLAVLGAFPAGNALIASLPAIYPPAGSTPAAVNLSGAWEPSVVKGRLTWTASADAHLDHYAIRYHPGPKYKAAEEQPVAIVAAGTTTYDTDFGLVASGSTGLFKAYVVVTTGNEKGSNAVRITRP